MDTPPDTPRPDIAARDIAERTYSAYAQQAEGPLHPQQEQALVTRLSEAARPLIAQDPIALVAAVNAALDAFEQAETGLRGPRLESIDRATGTVRLKAG